MALLALLVVQIRASSTRFHAPIQTVHVPAIRVGLQPYGGHFGGLELARHGLAIQRRLGASVVILPPRPLPAASVDLDRNQVDAARILDDLYVHRPAGLTHSVGVVSEDLFARDWEFLYGFSQAAGRVAVYSTARTDSRAHLEKVLVHELGHTLGLEHCPTPHCLMSTVEDAGGLDRMSRFYCQECESRLGGLEADASAPERGLARGDGLYARGAFSRAYVQYAMELLLRPTDPERLNRVGVAAAELGGRRVAERAYKLAVFRDETYAPPYYNWGLLYAAVDPARSSSLLLMGFERDDDRVEALGYLASVYAEVLRDEHRALSYFQAYVRAGGRSAQVMLRYRRLMSPAIFEFDDGEVSVFAAENRELSESLRWGWVKVHAAIVRVLNPVLFY